jgi:UDP-N-acetylmuramyl tripeptide synthase
MGLVIYPKLLSDLSKHRQIILVSATNGKTTTTALSVAGWGDNVATNATGANMPAGHVAALAASKATRAVLETDEAWLPAVIEATNPNVVVLLNLSRDQLDRATEVRAIAERWRSSLAKASKDLVVVANANDPLVVYSSEVAVDVRWCDIETSWTADAVSCPKCTQSIIRNAGAWSCVCGFAKPNCNTRVVEKEARIGDISVQVQLSIPGQFNIGNAVMAATALDVLGIEPTKSLMSMRSVSGIAGRFTLRTWQGRKLHMLLAKNPAGFEALLESLDPGNEDVWIAINARVADGKDPSWLYDVSFEQLQGRKVWCLGDRRLDLATRLDYANVSYEVVDDLNSLPASASTTELLANYTAFSDWMQRSTQ